MNKYEIELALQERINGDCPSLRELVERATPIKPIKIEFLKAQKCKCGSMVYVMHKFCSRCGQALDWSK